MTERVLVIGAGMAGLSTALALAPTGREVEILERDPPPPDGDADLVFAEWSRRGVGHLRHSHAFLARLRSILRDEHPALHAELLAAGCREIGFERMLTDLHKARYAPRPEDQDFVVLTSRRTTLELVIRRYVERLPGVVIRSQAFVRGLITERDRRGSLRVLGVTAEAAGARRDHLADIVVDASGRASVALEQLVEAGAPITEEGEPAGILYFTRHYRLNPGVGEPPRGRGPATGDLTYLKFGVFPGDNGCFSITLCLPEVEMELRKAIMQAETFDAICSQLPGLAGWVDPTIARGASRVFGMGELESRWRELAPSGRPAALNVFALGDSLVRTNPLYGRGCSFAAVQAYLLRDVIDEDPDPGRRLIAFQARAREALRPYYTVMRDRDRASARRARQALTPGHRPSLRNKLARSFLEDGVNIAVRSDPELLRAALRGFHMLEDPAAWLKRPGNLAKIVGYWARGRRRNAAAYPMKAGPGREEMMRAIGLSPHLDIERLRDAA